MQGSIVAVIPLYNGAEFIERSLRSVLSQTLQPDEIVIVDDGSKDDGPGIAAALAGADERIRVIRKTNGGQSSARNLGVSRSASQLIAFLDQDDWWYPNHLEVLKSALENSSHPNIGWAYSDLDEYDARGRMVINQMLASMPVKHPKRNILECLAHDMFVLPSASLITRGAFEEVGGFDESLSGYEDDDLFMRIFRAGYGNVYVEKPLSAWCIHSGSSSYTPRMAVSAVTYARKLIEEFPDDPGRNRYFVRDLIVPRFFRVLLFNYMRVVATGRRQDLQLALDCLDRLRPYLSGRRAAVIAWLRPLMGHYELARAGFRLKVYRLFRGQL